MLALLDEVDKPELDELEPILDLLEEDEDNNPEMDELEPKLLILVLGSVAGKKPESREVKEEVDKLLVGLEDDSVSNTSSEEDV